MEIEVNILTYILSVALFPVFVIGLLILFVTSLREVWKILTKHAEASWKDFLIFSLSSSGLLLVTLQLLLIILSLPMS